MGVGVSTTPVSLVAGVAKQVTQDNPNRSYLLIQNRSGSTVYFTFGGTADAVVGHELAPGATLYENDPTSMPTNAISCYCALAVNLIVSEG